MKKRAVMIVNPVAGRKKIQGDVLTLIAGLERQQYEVVVHVTRSRGDAVRTANREGRTADLIVCCGGDGTLNEVIRGLLPLAEKPLLLYYPCGSTNDFAVTLGLPTDPAEAAVRIDARRVLDLDVGRLNGDRNFSYITSFGIFTKASFSADQRLKNRIGHLAYLLQGAKELPDLGKFYRAKITYDGGSVEGDFALVAVTNSTSAGGVLRLPSEKVKLDDGLFEILLVKRLTGVPEAASTVGMLLSKRYDGHSVMLLQSRKVSISCPDAPAWCTDGEYAGNLTEGEIECLRGAVRIIV